MADSKISQLTPITGANLLDSDEFIVARADTFENFAVTRAELFLDTPDITTSDLTATTVDINGGTIDGTVIGGSTAAAGSFTTLDATGGGSLTGTWSDLGTVTTVDINGGTIDGTVIGGSTAAAISGTTGTFSGDLTVDTNTLFVDASTNQVGIGTSSPSATVHIASGAGANDDFDLRISEFRPNIVLEDLSSGATDFQFLADGGSLQLLYGDASTDTKLSNEAMRITSSGNVGIGTSSPAAPLEVNGVGSPSTRTAIIRSSGVVGVHLQSESNSSRNIFFQDNNGDQNSRIFAIGTLAGGDAQLRLDAGTFFRVDTNNSEAMRIDSSGNVGIGTSSPGSKLSVVGLPTSATGLSAGDIYIDAGTLKIVT